MAALSKAQQAVIERMRAGGSLFLNSATGLYAMTERGKTTKVDQRPVEAMLLAGVLHRDLMGRCTIAPEERAECAPAFVPDQPVRWARVIRGNLQGYVDATVVSATDKQVRIKTAAGEFAVVRPGALLATVP